jgi:hypothetical protein
MLRILYETFQVLSPIHVEIYLIVIMAHEIGVITSNNDETFFLKDEVRVPQRLTTRLERCNGWY